jgi:hypothetical protein
MGTGDQHAYVIAVRRDRRDAVAEGLPELLGPIHGLTITGAGNPSRIQVAATDAAVGEVRARFGDLVHVEPVIEHRTSAP